MFRLLLIDDNPVDRVLLLRELSREFPNLQVEEAIAAEDFKQMLSAGNFDLVITDYQLRWNDGLTILQEIKSRYPECPVIMFTDSGSLEIAVEAMKAGLDDYIVKSPKHYARLPVAVRSLWQRLESQRRAERLEMRLQFLLNHLNVGVFRSTLDGYLLEGNASFLRLLGVSSLQEAQSLDLRKVFPQQEAKLHPSNWNCEVQLHRADGSSIWVSLSQTLDTTEAEPTIEGLLEDITASKLAREALKQAIEELESRVAQRTRSLQQVNEQLLVEIRERQQIQETLRESEERYRQLVELCPDAILIRCEEKFVFVNSAAIKLFGAKNQEELIGRPVLDFVHPDYREIVKERMRQLGEEGTQPKRIEQKLVRLDGSAIDVEVVAAPFTYQQLSAAQVVLRDISDRKLAEAELCKSLEKERELNEFKSRIITTLSHEYRTPLTAIQSSAELLEHYSHKWPPEKKQSHFQRIQRSTLRLTNLINDALFLDRAEMDGWEFHPTPLNLDEFCQRLVEELRTGIQNQTTITLNVRGNARNACLDEELLRYILTNLLSNAIKYSPESSTIRFDLECGDLSLLNSRSASDFPFEVASLHAKDSSKAVAMEGASDARVGHLQSMTEGLSTDSRSGKRSPDIARFCIQDSGIGIPEAERSQLFESFYRASNVGTIPGTGLGLAIVKKCVDLHGGQITVDSVVGVGTTFTVTLPLIC